MTDQEIEAGFQRFYELERIVLNHEHKGSPIDRTKPIGTGTLNASGADGEIFFASGGGVGTSPYLTGGEGFIDIGESISLDTVEISPHGILFNGTGGAGEDKIIQAGNNGSSLILESGNNTGSSTPGDVVIVLGTNAVSDEGKLKIRPYASGNSVDLDFSGISANWDVLWPDKSGTIAFLDDVTGGPPGGNDSNIQFKDGSDFAGTDDFSWDDGVKTLYIEGDINTFDDSANTGDTTLRTGDSSANNAGSIRLFPGDGTGGGNGGHVIAFAGNQGYVYLGTVGSDKTNADSVGFPIMAFMSGAPTTGVPKGCFTFDYTNNRLYISNGSAWKFIQLI